MLLGARRPIVTGTWKQANLAPMFCSFKCSLACRKRMPSAHSPKTVETPRKVLIQRDTLCAEICPGGR